MQSKQIAMVLCPVCNEQYTNHTAEGRTTRGKVVSFPCCLRCRPLVEERLRLARMEMLGLDEDEEDEALDGEEYEEKRTPLALVELVEDEKARQYQRADDHHVYARTGTVDEAPARNKAPEVITRYIDPEPAPPSRKEIRLWWESLTPIQQSYYRITHPEEEI